MFSIKLLEFEYYEYVLIIPMKCKVWKYCIYTVVNIKWKMKDGTL